MGFLFEFVVLWVMESVFLPIRSNVINWLRYGNWENLDTG